MGKIGETYNIGGSNEKRNIDLIKIIIKITDKLLKRNIGESEKLITFVKDRKGHDFRYAIDSSKITQSMGWTPSCKFEKNLEKTILWYLQQSIK